MEQKKRVLIVEDEKSIVDILRFNLEKEGYAALTAYDGEAGLDQALKENPDLILLDVMLPKMNGFDVCRILREKGSSVPVIILTARRRRRTRSWAWRSVRTTTLQSPSPCGSSWPG